MDNGLFKLDTADKLERLIRERSATPPGDVAGVVGLLKDFAASSGAGVHLQEAEPGRENCLLSYHFGPGKKLVFNTHMDVNDPSGQRWGFDPFEPFRRDGKLYGVGACDAKGSLAAMLTAAERLRAKPDGLKGTLLITAVMGEEAGGLGSLHLAKTGLKADAAVVGEPTELKVCAAHKGTYMRRVTFRGRAAHSASSRDGINAVTHAARFCLFYEGLSRKLEAAPHPILGPADASVTLISGGTRQNTIPESCQVLIDRRLLPGEDAEKADMELAAVFKDLKAQCPETNVESVETVVSTVPSETAADSLTATEALRALSAVSGNAEGLHGFNAGCDMSKLNLLCGIPTVIFGPGSLANAHKPDEFVKLAELDAAVCFYENLARAILV